MNLRGGHAMILKRGTRFSRSTLTASIAMLLTVAVTHQAWAGSASWTGTASGNWTDATWTGGGVPPGSTTVDNSDVATFDSNPTANTTITVDANRYVGGITFGTTGGKTFTLQTGTLHLNSGGVIQTLSGLGANATINSPIVISGTSGATATFTANASAAKYITIVGNLTGSATSGNTTTLTLNGANTSANEIKTGAIGDGSGGGKLAITKSDAGTWKLSGANTFTGGLNLQNGTLQLGGATAAGNGLVTIGSAGNSATLDLSAAGGSRTINSLADAGTAANQTIGNGSGPGTATLNITGTGATSTFGGVIKDVVGAGSGTVGVTLNASGATLTLSGANTYSGTTLISAGTFIFRGSNSSAGQTSLNGASAAVQLDSASNGGLASGLFTFALGTVEALNATRTLANDFSVVSGGSTAVAFQGSQSIVINGKVTGASGAARILNNNIASGKTLTLNTVDINTDSTARTLTFQGTGNTIVTGTIANGNGTTTNGILVGGASISGVLTLAGSNTFTGQLSFGAAGGTLNINSSNALSTGTLALNSASVSTIDNTSGGVVTNAANTPISLKGGFIFGGSNDLDLGAGAITKADANSITITMNGSAGKRLTFRGQYPNSAGKPLTVNGAGSTLVLAGGFAITDTAANNTLAVIGGSGNINITGDVVNGGGSTASALTYTPASGGSVTLSGNCTYGGSTTVNGTGTVNLTGTMNGTSGITINSATVAFNESAAGTIQGAGTTFTLTTGNATLAGSNSYGGVTTVSAGTLVAGTNAPSGANGAFGNAISEIVLGTASGNNDAGILVGGGFEVGRVIRIPTSNNSDAGTRVLTLGGNSADNSIFSGNIVLGSDNYAGRGVTLTAASGGQVTFSGVIQNPTGMDATSYSVTKSGLGTVVLSGTNTYSGSTLISAGTLQIGAGGATGALAAGSAITNNATLTFNRSNTITQGADFNSVISGTGQLIQSGGGTLILNGANTYTGATIINAGTLLINGNQPLATGAINVKSSGTLGGTGAPGGLVTVESNGTIAPGNATTPTGTLSATNGLTLLSGGLAAFTADGSGTPTIGKVSVNGALTLNDNIVTFNAIGAKLPVGDYVIATFGSRTGSFSATAPTIGGLGPADNVTSVSLVYNSNDITLRLLGTDLPPTVNTFSPTNHATAVAPSTNLVLTFSENVFAQPSGNIYIKRTADNTTVTTIAANNAQVTVSGATVTINPTADLPAEIALYVEIDPGAFKDSGGNDYAGIADNSTWNFTTADITAPTVNGYSPTNSATAVAAGANLVMTFSENVVAQAGKNITIKKTSGDASVTTIPANDGAQVNISGATVTINPTSDLSSNGISYYVMVDSGAFKDLAGNSYTGIALKTTWNFTTVDTTAPTVNTYSPPDNATAVAPSANLVLTFSENVYAQAGKNIYIRQTSDNTPVATISANDASQVGGSGTATITVNPTADLGLGTGYYVEVDTGAFKDGAGNDYAGLSGASSWNFTTGSGVMWDGDTSSDWADSANWTGDAAPADDTATDIAAFSLAGPYSDAATPRNPTLSIGRSVKALNIGAANGAMTLSGSTLTVGGGNITVASAAATTISTTLAGTTTLNKSGAGTLTLSSPSANTFTGAVNIAGGTVAFASDNQLGNAANAINPISGGVLSYTGSGATALGASRVIATAANTGGINASDVNGTLTLGAAGQLTGSSGGVLIKSGPGTLKISAANAAFDGTLRVDEGTVNLSGSASAVGDATSRATLELNGGSLTIADNTGRSFSANLSVTAGSTLTYGLASAAAGVPHSFNSTSLGGCTLNALSDSIASSGTDQITLGALTLTGHGTISNTQNGVAAALVNIGAVSGNAMNLTVGGSGNTTITGAIGTTSGSVTKDGVGRLILSTASTFTGGVTLKNGTLKVQNPAALGDAASSILTIEGGSIDGTAITLNDYAQHWNGDFTFVGSAALNLGAGNVTLNASRTVTLTANTLTLNGIIGESSGGSGLTKIGSGTLVLNGLNTYTGPTIIKTMNSGPSVLQVAQMANGGSASGLGQSSSAAANLVLDNSGSTHPNGLACLQYTGASLGSSDRNFTLALCNDSAKGITFALGATGGGTLRFASVAAITYDYSYSGGSAQASVSLQNLSAGVVDLSTLLVNPNNNKTLGLNFGVSGGTLVLRNTGSTFSGGITFSDGSSNSHGNDTVEFSGAFTSSNPSSLGVGSLIMGNAVAGSTNTLRYADTLAPGGSTGATVVNTITYSPSAAGSILKFDAASGAGALIINPSTLTLGGTFAGIIELAASNSAVNEFKKKITDMTGTGTPANSLVKSGTGTWKLSGTNTYTGTTAINAGTLQVDGSVSVGSAVTVGGASATGTPALTGNGTVNGPVTVSAAGGGAAGTVNPGTVGAAGVLTVSNTVTLAGISTFDVEAANPTTNAGDQLNGITTLTYGGVLKVNKVNGAFAAGQSWKLFSFASQSGTFSNDADLRGWGDGVNLPFIGPGLIWQFDYSTGTLSVAMPPGTVYKFR